MNKCLPGKFAIILTLLLCAAFGLAGQDRIVSLSGTGNQALLNDNSDLGFNLQYRLGELKIRETQTKAGVFDELYVEGWSRTNEVGQPQLPMLRKLIAVPVGADVRFTVNSSTARDLSGMDSQIKHRILPAQESVSKSADPATITFALDEKTYATPGFAEQELVRVSEIGFMRGVRIFALDYFPVRYDPVQNSLRIVQEASVRIDFEHPDLIATAELLAKTGSWEFDRMYAQSLFNWEQNDRTSLVRYPTKILILCPPNYVSTLQTYVDWKKQQGYNVVVTTVGTGGTVTNSVSAIKTYMAGVWSAATAQDPAPTYLLIVGDTSTSGDNIIASPATVTSPSNDHVTDNYYVRLQGTDYVPEMYYGRFSVSSATELTNVITKTMTFEKTLMPSLSYLGNAVMIAGADATYAPTYGNGQINYGTTHYFNATNGITSDTYLYPASASSDAQVIANANAGRGYINYTAHGSETGWYDPAFSVSDVNAMTNTNKYGVMVGNCCLTNAFDYSSPCFGEAVIRKANAGGVAYIGGTNSTYWNEDYWWGIGYKTPIQAAAHPYSATTLGAYDAMFHTHGEAFTDWATTVGETNFMGNLAVVQSASTYQNYYWEIYSIMGDPSLMTYLGVPDANAATYPAEILIGATSITVTAEPYSRVALTMGGVNYGTALVPANGSLTLAITPFTTVGTAKLVITAQNKITLISDVAVIPNSGPYMSVTAVSYADGNNNAPDYNESGNFNVTFKNVGSVAATNVVCTLSCSTPGVTITDGTETVASLAAGATTTVNGAYGISIANNVANGTVANFTITMVGASTWTNNFSQTLNAPALAFGTMAISDPAPGNGNGRLDPGETVTVTMPLNNAGGAASPAGSGTLTCATSGITVNSGNASFSAIAPFGTANLTFSVTAASSVTVGTVANLVFNAVAGAYTANKTENLSVGLIVEDFSTGNFNSYPWIQGSYPWTIDNGTYHSAGYAAKSGTITHSQSSTLETTRVLTSSGTLTFYYKVSSEATYDFLKFYIDGAQQNQWSGTVDWTQASYTLAAGPRVLKWEYVKDGSVSNGSDCAWVDDIVFPASTNLYSFYPPQNLTAFGGNGFVNLNWQAPAFGTPTGYKIFKNGALLNTVTGLTYTDTAVVNGSTYSYYLTAVYTGGESGATATVNATPSLTSFVVIGTGTSNTGTNDACPINVWYQSLHGQSVYLASELNAAGVTGPINITQIGFNVTGLPSLAMPNFVVRMGHTASTNVSSWISSGLTTVYSATSYQPTTTGYNMLTLSTPFTWNGTSNIVIDTAFGLIGSYNSSGTTQYSSVTNGYRYLRSDSTDETSVFNGGSTSTYRPNVRLGVAAQASPEIVVNPLSIPFGSVAVGSTVTQQFTIQNIGSAVLNGTISTPTGYSVALAARGNEIEKAILKTAAFERNTLSYSVNAGSSKTFTLTFAPTAATAYNGNAVVTSNDSDEGTVNIALTGSGYIPNHAPTIDLPNCISLEKNATLVLDFTPFLNDQDNDPLTLAVTGNSQVLVDISGLTVTLSTVQNWTGLEYLTFTVSDGIATASDVACVNVYTAVAPDWTPVSYPNNSATVYGVATIDWTACALNDMVGAFVGKECRGMCDVTVSGGQAYATLLVNLASEGETVSFRIWDYTTQTTYPVLENYSLNFGQVLGDSTPIPINGVSEIILATPEPACAWQAEGLLLNWPAVPFATSYNIYRATEPYGEYIFLANVSGLQYLDESNLPAAFYRVRAERELWTKRSDQ